MNESSEYSDESVEYSPMWVCVCEWESDLMPGPALAATFVILQQLLPLPFDNINYAAAWGTQRIHKVYIKIWLINKNRQRQQLRATHCTVPSPQSHDNNNNNNNLIKPTSCWRQRLLLLLRCCCSVAAVAVSSLEHRHSPVINADVLLIFH